MARLPRVVVVDVAHHITQRGNARQAILANDAGCLTYLNLLRKHCELYRLSLIGYCLMPNHVHLIAVPHTAEALAQTLKHTHGRYAAYWNADQLSTGQAWQGRFYSCPMDEPHLWAALRYTELNPVRAGLVEAAQQWRWSSAAAHNCPSFGDSIIDMNRWQRRWTVLDWAEYLNAGEAEDEVSVLRKCTHTGRPLGTPKFVERLEKSTSRMLAPRKGGRPRKVAADYHNAA